MKHIIIDGDMVTFLPTYGSAIVVPIPTTISLIAEMAEAGGSAVCLEGGEGDVESASGSPDSTTEYSGGKDMFVNSNMSVEAN